MPATPAGGSTIVTPTAQVTIGTVTATDTLSKLVTNTTVIWNDYMVKNRYEGDNHIYMMGITSPNGFQGASVAFAQLASPTLLWIAEWTASCFGQQPVVPNPAVT